ncbi:flagellar biosynthesis protein FlhA [Vibrio mediterranei]|uniref:flagellar biosynthesis protein FlhA n=1 Tax=Vibrio mediterranei TaxID=689 RepID=UPI0040685B93
MNFLKTLSPSRIAIPLVLLAILSMVILPIPPWLLDTMFVFNITLAILILLKSATTTNVLQFSVFPTLLLIATLMRLTLNVASTRVVLLEGHNGGDAAGKVIQSFGEVVIGGSYVVGIIVFAILMIINFMVVTKGAERISEVSARFTLDALPGKQMAIDADLNAGLIDQDQAKKRRSVVSDEAEFHGAMDGASKFVKGDAIAGLIILAINLVGGILIGMFEHGLDGGTSFKTYGLLTIGDGLVAQIPSLLLATAAAILVTRINDQDRNVAQTVNAQIWKEAGLLYMAAGVMFVIGAVPNMPRLAFWSFAVGLALIGYLRTRNTVSENDVQPEITEQIQTKGHATPLDWSVIPKVDPISLSLGLRLVPLATTKTQQTLIKSLRGTRKTLSEKVGFLIPEVVIRDDFSLKTAEYVIKIDGDEIERGEVQPDRLMVVGIPPGDKSLEGVVSFDPAYKLPALWIEPQHRTKAIGLGFSVIDVHDVIATHVIKVCSLHLARIFNFDDVKSMNQRLALEHPELADTLEKSVTPNLQMVIVRKLLIDQVPVNNIRTIANTIIETSEQTKDPFVMASNIRMALGRTIVNLISPSSRVLKGFLLSKEVDQAIQESISSAKKIDPNLDIDAVPLNEELLESLKSKFSTLVQTAMAREIPPLLIVPPASRPLISRITRTFERDCIVISYAEVPEDYTIDRMGEI